MITIIPKPTDTPGDNSTGMVIHELQQMGRPYSILDIDRLDPFDFHLDGGVIWVCGLKQDQHQFEVINALSVDHRVINSPLSIFTCASKVMTSALLHKHNIPTPKTLFTASRDEAIRFLREQGSVVSKPVYGFDGIDVKLVGSPDLLPSPPYYLQEYVPNDRDFRIFVINGKAVGGIMRMSDSLAHNIHQGGRGIPCEIDPEMQEVAGNAARVVGVDYAGVDLLRTKEGYCVLEVNGTPNWHCMSAPVPRLLAEYFVEQERLERK